MYLTYNTLFVPNSYVVSHNLQDVMINMIITSIQSNIETVKQRYFEPLFSYFVSNNRHVQIHFNYFHLLEMPVSFTFNF